MEFHPAANIFPMMIGKDFEDLCASIAKNGQREPILIFEDKILDGRNRFAACLKLKIEPVYKQWEGDDPWEYVWDANAERRHLEQFQKALIKIKQLEGQGEWLEARRLAQEEANKARTGRPPISHLSNDKTLNKTPVEPDNWSHYQVAKQAGVSDATAARAQALWNARPDLAEEVINGEMKPAEAIREKKRSEVIEKLEDIKNKEIKIISGVYDVIVIDPPWPMQKIERDVAPLQVEFDYPTMSLEEIGELNIPCAEDCHVFLWTTHKYLPSALEILIKWEAKYILSFVWHKNGGFQPFGLPQYNCEFALYARIGTPEFIDFKDFKVCFNAPRGAHSEKPEEFYETLRRVTAGRRLDMFNRRKIDGFDTWGNES